MKITKLVHSCLVIEDQDRTVLIDPGIYSWNSGLVDVNALPKLDAILITHVHPDHCYPPFIKAVIAKFGGIPIVSNSDVAQALYVEGIDVIEQAPAFATFKTVQHASLWFDFPTPQNCIFTVFNRLTHIGDTHDFDSTSEILALPILAPWGSFKDAMEQVRKLKPQKVVPIHDWWLSPEGRKWFYDRAEQDLAKINIEFLKIKDGESIEV